MISTNKTLNIYAHQATSQQHKSMTGQGVPLNFIKNLETGVINIKDALKNVKKYMAIETQGNYHTADLHCALAAVHFVIARDENYGDLMLENLRNTFIKEMNLFFKFVDFRDKVKLDDNLTNIVLGTY